MTDDQIPMTSLVVWCLVLREALALPLFVACVGTNDVHSPFAPHDFAVLANPFDAGSNFHGTGSVLYGAGIAADLCKAPEYIDLGHGRKGSVKAGPRSKARGPK